MAEKTFSELGRVQAIKELFEGSGYKPFGQPLSITLHSTGGSSTDSVVSASKMYIEGTDFSLVYFPLKHLGYKCVTGVTGELYAALSHPQTLSVTLGVSAKLDFPQIKEFWEGAVVAAKEHGYTSLDLELLPSQNGFIVSMAAEGLRGGAFLSKRTPAKSKDLICVSGSLGSAFLGLQVLERKPGELEKYKMMVGDYLKPELRPYTLAQLEETGIIPAMGLFVSRGLSDAILRISRDSGLGAKIYAERIPFEGNSFALGKELDLDPISAAMNGGDDFRLLYVVSLEDYERFRTDFQTFDIIGHLAQPEVGAVLVTPDGLEHEISAQGW